MDVHSLDGAVKHSALAQSSHKTHQAAANEYLRALIKISSLPTLEASYIVLFFCLFGSTRSCSFYIIRTYLLGIRQLQIAQGLPKPRTESMPRLCQILRGI